MALHHATSGEVIDLRAFADDVRNTRTSALVKSDSFEAIQLVVRAGAQIDAHEVAGQLTLLCMEGRVTIGLQDGAVELSAGQWVFFDGGVRHSVDAIEDSSLLLTIIFGDADEPR
jgi:quercetin dioxygenase-like cupin family protein